MIGLRSLRARMTAAVTLLFALWMTIVGAASMLYLHESASRHADRVLATTVAELRQNLPGEEKEHPSTGEAGAIAAFCEEYSETLAAGKLGLLLVDSGGKVVRRYPGVQVPWPISGGHAWRVRSLPVGRYTAVLGLDWHHTEEELRDRITIIFAVGLCGVLAAGLGAWILVGRTLLPIRHLSEQAGAAAPDALHVRLESPSQDAEIVGLVATLNGLLDRLAKTAAAKGHFYAAASHELRTPLQALSGHLEVALSRPRSADDYHAALDEAYAQTRRLISLVGELLVLNQLDGPAPPSIREPVSLSEVCERALQQLLPVITERGLRLAISIHEDGEVMAPRPQAEMLLRNIIDNAVHYASPGGKVSVSLQESPGHVSIEVFNECPPLPDWDPEALFEPFHREDASRSRVTGGNGLGLAICRAIALANGWGLSLAHDGAGVRASLDFPTAHAG